MRSFSRLLLLVLFMAAGAASAADADNSANERKKKAEATWEAIAGEKPATEETKHFFVLAPEAMAKQLKSIGELLEKHHDKAKEALKFEMKEEDKGEVLPGKVVVYLFGERDHFKAFVRRIESRRLLPEETASYQAGDDKLHVAAGPPAARQGLPVEIQACEQVAGVMLARRAGVRTPLPDWLVAGFGRATYYRVAPRDRAVIADRGLAARLSRKHTAAEIWDGKVAADEADALQGSLVDFLAYSPAASSFPKFIAGFTPGENGQRKTTAQAFQAANLKSDRLTPSWRRWVPTSR